MEGDSPGPFESNKWAVLMWRDWVKVWETSAKLSGNRVFTALSSTGRNLQVNFHSCRLYYDRNHILFGLECEITRRIGRLLEASKKAQHKTSTTCEHFWRKLTSLDNRCPFVEVCVLGQVSPTTHSLALRGLPDARLVWRSSELTDTVVRLVWGMYVDSTVLINWVEVWLPSVEWIYICFPFSIIIKLIITNSSK
jgi:hypothetical protein